MITLESIKNEQSKLAKMIDKIEEDMKKSAFFVYQGKRIPLELGEKYVGTIISADGSRNHHIILLPGEIENSKWKKAMEWAESIGGELPDRCEGSLLLATMKDEFKPEWYWTREQHASDSDYAWTQHFTNGDQRNYIKINECRARAVRRLEIL
jgi:hypothetical protein